MKLLKLGGGGGGGYNHSAPQQHVWIKAIFHTSTLSLVPREYPAIVSTTHNSFDLSWAKDFIFHEDICNSALLQKFTTVCDEYIFQVKSTKAKKYVTESLWI